MANTGDSLGAGASDTMLPVVPLFHANSWGIAFSAPSMGTKLVLPGAKLDGASVFELLETEKVTHTAGVPDGVADAAQPHGRQQAEAAAFAHGGVRRLGDAALDDQGVHRYGRDGAARLGHDRDEPDRHAGRAQAAVRRVDRRSGARHPPDPGLPAVRRADENHRRCRQGTALGRQDLRPPQGRRALGRQGLLPRRCRYPRRERLLRHRRCRHHRSATAICGSPTAPRT